MELKGQGNSDLLLEACIRDSREKTQNSPAAVTNYALFYDGRFVTNEILFVGKFEKIAGTLMK